MFEKKDGKINIKRDELIYFLKKMSHLLMAEGNKKYIVFSNLSGGYLNLKNDEMYINNEVKIKLNDLSKDEIVDWIKIINAQKILDKNYRKDLIGTINEYVSNEIKEIISNEIKENENENLNKKIEKLF